MDTYTALSMGASVYSLSKYAQEDMRTLFESLRESGADTWVSTPSFADLVLADRAFSEELMLKLERFIFCGERLTLRTVTRLYERFPKSRIINTYGPTELSRTSDSVVTRFSSIQSLSDRDRKSVV